MTKRTDIDEWSKATGVLGSQEFVSVYPGGRIGIPKSVHVHLLDECEYIKLKYAGSTHEIGLQPAEKSKDAYKVDQNNRSISAYRFLKHYNLTPEETVRHPVSDNTEDTIWIDTDYTESELPDT